jgi:hypothetical protein
VWSFDSLDQFEVLTRERQLWGSSALEHGRSESYFSPARAYIIGWDRRVVDTLVTSVVIDASVVLSADGLRVNVLLLCMHGMAKLELSRSSWVDCAVRLGDSGK